MKRALLTLSLFLGCLAPLSAIGQQLPNDFDKVQIVVPDSDTVVGVATALKEGLTRLVGLNDDDVSVDSMRYNAFKHFPKTVARPGQDTLQILIVFVDPGQPLPSYVENANLIGAVAEEPLVIYEATSGSLDEVIGNTTIGSNPLKVGVFGTGTALIANEYFRSREVDIDLHFENDFATAREHLQEFEISALVGPYFPLHGQIVVAKKVKSIAADLPRKVPTANGFLAFSRENLPDPDSIPIVLKKIVGDDTYRSTLAGLGLQAHYIEGTQYLMLMNGIGGPGCDICICGNVECENSCDLQCPEE